jgi:IS5 family transposase
MAASVLQKRGHWSRENQARQGFGKGSKVMAIADRTGLPVALCAGSASPHETKFVKELIEHRITEGKPDRLIGDKAYDSDPLDTECDAIGVTMISPHKSNRKKPKTQDGRALRRYKRRWKVERATLQAEMESRTTVCMATKLSPACHSI